MTDYILSAELSLKDRFTAKINAATKASENFKEKLKKTDSILKSFGDSRKLDKFSQKIDSVKNKISKIAFNTAKWGAVAGTGALIGASKIGADFEALGARMETAFQGNKKKAAEYFKWANEFANKTPFSNDEVIDATVRLKSYGYDPKRLMTILGDMAGAYGKTLEQSVEAYADASRGEYERLKEFGIQKDEVINFAKEEMGKEIKMSGEKVKDMDTFMKALEGLIKSRSKDGMKHLANTLSGMLSTTKGLLKYNIAKLVGVTDEGNVRAGSLIDRIKQKFEKFNTYMESEEGKKAMNKWIDAFDEALPQVIEIVNSIKEKFKEIAGENFMEKLNTSIKNFEPSDFNDKLQSIKDNFDELTEKAMRYAGLYMGIMVGKAFGVKGVVAGGLLGYFSPEIADAIEKLNKNEEEYERKRNEAVENSREAQRKTGWLPKQSTATYAPRMQMIEETKTKENEKWWNFLIKDRGNGDFNFSEDDIKLKYTPEFKTPELKFKETIKNYSKKETIKEKVENIKSENEVINDFAKEIVNIDNRVFNTTTNNYIKDEKTEDNSEKSYNSLNNYESNRIDNSKSITNSEINNNSFSSQNNIDNSKSSVSDNELSNIYNSENNNDNSKVYNSETENKNDNSKHIVNNKEVSNTHNSSSTNNTTDNSKVYNNNTETKEVKEKVRTLKQNITNHNNITIKIDGAITNRDDKIAYENIANKLRTELQKTIDKTFENMTTEIEFA